MKTESQEQIEFVNWTKKQSLIDPIFGLLFAIPNGGKRNIVTASRLKLEGVKAGVPDLFFPVARRNFHGLFIEMKKQKGETLSKDQKTWFEELNKQGYAVVVAKGAQQAKILLLHYLKS